jgi:hypothetical protein
MGTGLQDDLSSFCTAADDLDQASIVQVPELPEEFDLFGKGGYEQGFTLRSFEVEGFVGAFAVDGPVSSVRWLQWVW